MRVNTVDKSNGVLVRGFKDRRLVANIPTSLEPMVVNIPVVDIRQVAVLGSDPTDKEKRFTVAVQLGADRWVRLGVFDTATEAEEIIRSVATAIAGSRWTNVWIMIGMSLVAGFLFTVLGAYFVNSQVGAGQPLGVAHQAAPSAMVMPAPAAPVVVQDPTPAASMAPAAAAAPAPAAGNPGIQMSSDTEAVMRDYFATDKK